jgi:hypothetical protein
LRNMLGDIFQQQLMVTQLALQGLKDYVGITHRARNEAVPVGALAVLRRA